MKTVRYAVFALLGVFALVACAEATDDLQDAATSLAESGDLVETASEIRTELEQLGSEIENSEASAELQEGWDDLRTELSSAVESMLDNDAIDTEAIEEAFNSFQSEIEAAGDSVSDELENAWNELRESIQGLLD